MGDARHRRAAVAQRLLDVVRGCFAFHRWIGCQDHFIHLAGTDVVGQGRQAQFLRADAVDGRQSAVQHVVATAETASLLDSHDVRWRFDDAQHAGIALRVGADGAQIGFRQRPAAAAALHALRRFGQHRGQRLRTRTVVLQQMQRGARGGLGANAGLRLQRFDQAVDQRADSHWKGSFMPAGRSMPRVRSLMSSFCFASKRRAASLKAAAIRSSSTL